MCFKNIHHCWSDSFLQLIVLDWYGRESFGDRSAVSRQYHPQTFRQVYYYREPHHQRIEKQSTE